MMGFDVSFPEDFLSDLLSTEFTEIAMEAAEEAAPELRTAMQIQMGSVISHEGGSDLVSSVKVSKPKKAKNGAYIVNVGPSGKDKTGTRNVLKAVLLEYGTPHRAPRPWLDTATNNARTAIMEVMQRIYNKKVGADK